MTGSPHTKMPGGTRGRAPHSSHQCPVSMQPWSSLRAPRCQCCLSEAPTQLIVCPRGPQNHTHTPVCPYGPERTPSTLVCPRGPESTPSTTTHSRRLSQALAPSPPRQCQEAGRCSTLVSSPPHVRRSPRVPRLPSSVNPPPSATVLPSERSPSPRPPALSALPSNPHPSRVPS